MIHSSLVVSAGILVALWATTALDPASPLQSSGGQEVEASSSFFLPHAEEQGDGVRSRCWLQMTPVLHDSSANRDVRYISYTVNFESAYAAPESAGRVLIGSIHGLVDVDPDAATPVESGVDGLDPGLGLPLEQPSPPAHTYKVIVHPPEGQPWGAASARDVVVDVIRVQ